MSLTVNAYKKTPGGRWETLPCEHASELAGFESCRRELWGHVSIRDLGATLLPSLIDSDVDAEGDALDQLQREAEEIIAHAAAIATATGYEHDYIVQRCENILGAVRRAKEIGGGVVIW